MNKRKWEYTLQMISECSGVSIHTVRDHVAGGQLVPQDLRSVAKYVAGYLAIQEAKHEADIWGEIKG